MELVPGIRQAKILDYGAGHGGFLQAGSSVFPGLIGFDLSKRVCASHQAAGWSCVNSLEEISRDIEVVVLFHVLEHLRRPWERLSSLRQRFSLAHTFVIEVPNTDEALNSVFRNQAYRRNHFSADHVYYFTSKTLRQVVEAGGLSVIVDTQLQRYTLANTLGWIRDSKGGGQNVWNILNDSTLNEQYENVLIRDGIADSIFMVCKAKEESRM
jgi:hypothetical protein